MLRDRGWSLVRIGARFDISVGTVGNCLVVGAAVCEAGAHRGSPLCGVHDQRPDGLGQ